MNYWITPDGSYYEAEGPVAEGSIRTAKRPSKHHKPTITDGVFQEWVLDNAEYVREVENDLERAVDLYIDSVAKARRYGTATTSPTASCLSYNNSNNLGWKADAKAFTKWRDDVIAYIILQADLVYQGLRTIPTEEELITEIQTNIPMVWPS